MGLMILSGDFCDFCNNRGNLKWTYKVRPFEMFTYLMSRMPHPLGWDE